MREIIVSHTLTTLLNVEIGVDDKNLDAPWHERVAKFPHQTRIGGWCNCRGSWNLKRD